MERTVEITVINRSGIGSHVETVQFTDFPALKARVASILEAVSFHKVEVELVASWDTTEEEQEALDKIETEE